MASGLINENPIVYEKSERRVRTESSNTDELSREAIDQLEVFDHIRDIKDPEHPLSLEQLRVVTEDSVEVDDEKSHVRVTFTPTMEHCSMATLIGLCIRVKLMRSLPSRYKIDIRVAPGTHETEAALNKQINDKERVAAALENPNLVEVVDECFYSPQFSDGVPRTHTTVAGIPSFPNTSLASSILSLLCAVTPDIVGNCEFAAEITITFPDIPRSASTGFICSITYMDSPIALKIVYGEECHRLWIEVSPLPGEKCHRLWIDVSPLPPLRRYRTIRLLEQTRVIYIVLARETFLANIILLSCTGNLKSCNVFHR